MWAIDLVSVSYAGDRQARFACQLSINRAMVTLGLNMVVNLLVSGRVSVLTTIYELIGC